MKIKDAPPGDHGEPHERHDERHGQGRHRRPAKESAPRRGRRHPLLAPPDRPGDVRHSLANIDHAASILRYAPTHTIEEGIFEAMPWYVRVHGVGSRQ